MQTIDHRDIEQTLGMQSRPQRMGDNADIKDTADTVETRDLEQMDRELGWITKITSYIKYRRGTRRGS